MLLPHVALELTTEKSLIIEMEEKCYCNRAYLL